MASIRDVAKRANVAASTVSRVLNDNGYVSEETRRKIKKAMEELDYIPNELARNLFRKKTGIVAMMVPDISHPFFSSLAKYIEKELYERGYKTMLCSSSNDINREKDYMEMLKRNMVDGIITGAHSLEDEDYKKIDKPIIMLDRFVDNIPTVISNHKVGGELAAQKIIDSGCKNVVQVCGSGGYDLPSHQRHISFNEVIKKHNIEITTVEIDWNSFEFGFYMEIANDIMDKYPDIDGVFAADMLSAAFLKVALQRGRLVPEDFKVVAYDGTYTTDSSTTSLSTVVQSVDKLAKAAVSTILDLIEGREIKSNKVIIDVFFREGQTTY